MKKHRQKITWNLTILIAGSLIILMGLVIGAQFFVISRTYMTTEYTKNREIALVDAAKNWNENYQNSIYEADQERLVKALNRFANENNAYCFLFDEDCNVLLFSDNARKLPSSYTKSIQKNIQSGDVFEDTPPSFRIKNSFGFYTRYIGIGHIIYHYDSSQKVGFSSGQTITFIAVTKEVYTSDNYKMLIRYSLLLFLTAALLALLLSYVISRRVTKPVLQMRSAAQQMITMDFSQKCTYHSEDELGELADSLNFLSDRLDKAIKELEQANKKLQNDLDVQKKIDQMRRSFIASASHEFKTPLTLLRGYLEMMQENRLGQEQQRQAQEIMIKEIDRLDRMVLNMLRLSRLEDEHYEMKMQRFDIAKLLRQKAAAYEPIMEKQNLTCCVRPQSGSIFVKGNEEEIEQVIINFLSNAIKYCAPKGTILLQAKQEKNRVLVCVSNPGEPIGKEHIEHLWEAFYRADKSRARKTGGNGLGLAICSEILRQHKSHYGVRNEKDGVTFFFDLESAQEND